MLWRASISACISVANGRLWPSVHVPCPQTLATLVEPLCPHASAHGVKSELTLWCWPSMALVTCPPSWSSCSFWHLLTWGPSQTVCGSLVWTCLCASVFHLLQSSSYSQYVFPLHFLQSHTFSLGAAFSWSLFWSPQPKVQSSLYYNYLRLWFLIICITILPPL